MNLKFVWGLCGLVLIGIVRIISIKACDEGWEEKFVWCYATASCLDACQCGFQSNNVIMASVDGKKHNNTSGITIKHFLATDEDIKFLVIYI